MNFISYPLTVYAFHGCDREIAEAVLSGRQELKASENRWDWLGTGAYFWESAPERNVRCHVFDTVRGAFPEGDPVFDESQILTKTHVQICVRNPESIAAYFLPYPTQEAAR